MPTAICETCKKEFKYRYKGRIRRFCSTACTYPNRFTIKTQANCPICGDPFIRVDSSDKNARRTTCGKQKCQKSRKNHPNYSHKIEIICSGCGKKFITTSRRLQRHVENGYKHYYCSSKCSSDHTARLAEERRSEKLIAIGLDPKSYRICRECGNPKPLTDFSRSNRLISRCKQCLYKFQKQRWIKRKEWAIKYLGGKCIKCGYHGHWAAFDFHHRDQNTKEFEWHKLRLRTKEAIKEELDKCDLLCAICHRVEHAS